MYRNLCLTLALLVFCMVLALIQRELLARLLHNAYRDVTGIHNKKSLEKKLLELNDRATTFGVGVMMFDLNNLKHVNDTYGHEKGDEFIQAFAYCLTRILDEHSFLARYGGDEFIIIQENTTPEELKHMDLHLSTLVQEYNTRASLPLSYAVGFEVSYRNHYFLMDDLINAADKNMYQDKVTLCGSNAYEKKYYLNPDFSGLPEQIKQELQIACVLFTAEVGGVLTLEFDEEGKLNFVTHVEDNDFFYDEIGSELMIKKLRQEKQDFWESLELYYKIFLLGEDEV